MIKYGTVVLRYFDVHLKGWKSFIKSETKDCKGDSQYYLCPEKNLAFIIHLQCIDVITVLFCSIGWPFRVLVVFIITCIKDKLSSI